MSTEKQKKFYTVVFSCVIIFTALYFIVNLSVVADFFSGILSVLAPIIVGAAIAYILNPILKLYEYKILKKLKSKTARRNLSIALTYLTALLFVVAFLWLVIPQLVESIVDLTKNFDTYLSKTTKFINGFIHNFYEDPDSAPNISEETIMSYVSKFFSTSGSIFSVLVEYIKGIIEVILVGVKNAVLGIFISVYIMIYKENLHAHMRKLTTAIFKERSKSHLLRYIRIANKTFGNYFVGMLFDAILLAIIAFIVFSIFGIPYALLISVIIGITNVIPIFGPFIGAIPSAFIIFVNDPIKALVFVILIIILQQIDGNIIAPKILGNSIGISSLGVIIAIIIMGAYFGILGMIVGVPVFAVILTLCEEIIDTKLKSKELSTDIAEYYPAYSLVDPNEHHERPGAWIFRSIESIIKKIIKLFRQIFKKKADAEADENQTAEADKQEVKEEKEEKEEKEVKEENENHGDQ